MLNIGTLLAETNISGGFGSAIAEVHDAPVLILGWGDIFIPQGNENELRSWGALDTETLRARITRFVEELAP